MTTRAIASLFLSLSLTLVVGCGEESKETVTGTVTMDGAPLTSGYVQFTNETSRAAVGQLNDQGQFEVRTSRTVAGMDAGTYKVVVTYWEKEPTIDEEGISLIDEKFTTVDTTPLTAEVTDGGMNDFEFTVTPRVDE